MTINTELISTDPTVPALTIELPAISHEALMSAIREATKNIHTVTEWLAAEEKTLAKICQVSPLAPGSSVRMKDTQAPIADDLGQCRVPGRDRAA